ncbi:MAG: hypothetical protein PVH73_08790 [Candidatus Bathyarchaeota archaeon]
MIVTAFFIDNTLVTNITNTSRNPFHSREKWLVLPTPHATQRPIVKIRAQNSALSEQKPHYQTGKNDGDTAKRIQKHHPVPSQ